MKKQIKLSQLIILVFIILAATAIIIYSSLTYNRFKASATGIIEAYGIMLAGDLAFSASDFLFNENYPALEHIISEYETRNFVTELSILNTDNIVVAGSLKDELGKESKYISECDEYKEICISGYKNEEIRFIRKVVIEEELLGQVIIVLTLDAMNMELHRIILHFVFIGAVFLTFCIIISLLLSKIISKPVQRLNSAVRIFSESDYRQLETGQWISELSQLQDSYNVLAGKLDRREKQLKDAKTEAERANSAKSVFLANISHELRTPLNGITGFASLLNDTELDDSQKMLLDKILISSETLTSIIRNLLDLIELESGLCRLQKEDFNFEHLMNRLKHSIDVMLGGKQVKFEYEIRDDCKRVTGDEERVEQILVMLLNNSVKFTHKGWIRVKIYWDETVIIQIDDTGIGIPRDKQQEVFSLLYQVENPLEKVYRGVGIGLSIVKLLVELMGGEIQLKSSEGTGTAVTIRLPLDRSVPDPPDNPSGHEGVSGLGKKILLVEDEAINRMYLKMALEKAGFTVDDASDGMKAIELFNRNDYCLILMDIGLPGKNGIDISMEIRKNPKYQVVPVPIIAVTANTEEEIRRKCKKAGITYFISKPVNQRTLFDIIGTTLSQS